MVRIILSVIFLGGAWFLFTNVTDPTFASIDDLKAEGSRLDIALTRANELRAERTKLSSKFNLFSEDEKSRLEKFLPETIDNVRLLIDIDRIAGQHNIALSSLAVQSTRTIEESRGNTGGYGIAELNFSMQTTYGVFLALLEDLERSLRLIDVTEVTFSAPESDAQTSYTVKIQTYWLAS